MPRVFLHPLVGDDKAMASPGMARDGSAGRTISHASSSLFTELGKLCSGARRAPGELSWLCASLAAFSPLPSFPSEDDVLLRQTQHRCPAASSRASSSSSRRRSPAGLSPAVRQVLTLSPRLLFLFLFYFRVAAPAPFS